MPDVIHLLEAGHDEIADYLGRVEETGRAAEKDARHRAVEDLVEAARVQSRAKRHAILPVVMEKLSGGPEAAADRGRELDGLDEVLERLHGLSSDDPAYEPELRRVVTEVKDHITSWELKVLPPLRDDLDTETRTELGEGYEQVFGEIERLDGPRGVR